MFVAISFRSWFLKLYFQRWFGQNEAAWAGCGLPPSGSCEEFPPQLLPASLSGVHTALSTEPSECARQARAPYPPLMKMDYMSGGLC